MQHDSSYEPGFCLASLWDCQWECLSVPGFLAASGQTWPQACAAAGTLRA